MSASYLRCCILLLIIFSLAVRVLWQSVSAIQTRRHSNTLQSLSLQRGLPIATPEPQAPPVMCVAVTFKPTSEALKLHAYSNTARMYRNLSSVLVFLAVTESGGAHETELHIWRDAGYSQDTILNSTASNPHGTPFLSSIVHQLELVCPESVPFVAYANADIMFDNDLQQTLHALHEWSSSAGTKIMAVGRRSNHGLSGTLKSEEIKLVASELDIQNAQDYFIMSRTLINWETIPSFVIGRLAYDNALVDWAHHNTVLVDVTETLLALHQTTHDGNRAGHSYDIPDRDFNNELPDVSYDHGTTDDAHFKTYRLFGDGIGIIQIATGEQVWPMVQGAQTPEAAPTTSPETKQGISGTLPETAATSGTLFMMRKQVSAPSSTNTPQVSTPFALDSYPVGLKWAVITSIFPPTRLIKSLVQIEGWCTVVVADTKSLPEKEYIQLLELNAQPRCFTYLSMEKQSKFDYAILQHVPINSFGRKNIGFIFAVHHGAKVIYDTDDDNEIADEDMLQFWASLEPRDNPSTPPYWQWTDTNPYLAHGGNTGIWPRGLPLDQVKNRSSTESSIRLHPPNDICIIQSLADREPDVDAIYRLTNPNYPTYFTPNTRYSISTARHGQMAPFNAQATLFFASAFDAMLLPVSVHGRVSDIWRGYMAQSLIRPRCALAFAAPWVTQVRNSHNYLADFDAEIPLYRQAPAYVEHLKRTSYSTLAEAAIDAYEHGILGETDARLASAWLVDMERAKLSAQALLQRDETGNGSARFRHLLILMGRGVHLKQWMTKITKEHLEHVDLVLGIFDHTAQSLECPVTTARMTCISLAGTTWTSGRNALAVAAFNRESSLNRKYNFWTFADADIVLHCLPNTDCFSAYDTFLAGMPVNVWAAAIFQNGFWEARENTVMVEVQAFDAAWNSIRREAIPIMLPYSTEEDHNSWWSSQAIFWNRMQCLAPLYAVAPLYVFFDNSEHNEYPRNPRNIAREQQIGGNIMGRLASVLPRAPTEFEGQFQLDKIRHLPLPPMEGPFSETFQRCAAEFAGDFYSFASETSPT